MNEEALRAKLNSVFQDRGFGLHSPESLGQAIVAYALREAPTKGFLGADGNTLELPLTVRVDAPRSNVARTRVCATICAYAPGGHELGCVQICVEAWE